MHELKHNIRVRYAECDSMGFVHHSVYALYLEEARTECLRNIGLIYAEMEKNGILMPVRNMNFQFKLAAHYDDLLSIEAKIVELPVTRCKIEYTITNQHNHLICTAYTELFFVQKESLKPIKLPEQYAQLMHHLF